MPLLDASVFVHPLALCDSSRVGARTRVWAFAHVADGAVVGADCTIGESAYIASGAVVGDRVTVRNAVLLCDGVTVETEVFLGPGTCFTNDCRPRAWRAPVESVRTWVRRGATLGANCTVVCGVVIGEFALVGAGSVVTADVAPQALVVGNPARQRGWVCVDGQPLDPDGTCDTCGRMYPELTSRPTVTPLGRRR